MQDSHEKFEYTKIERMRNERNGNTEKSNYIKLVDEVNHSQSEQLEKLTEQTVLGKKSNHRKKRRSECLTSFDEESTKKQFSAFIIR